MELCIANESWYVEKAQTKKNDCELENTDK